MRIVVNDIAASSGGALTVLKDFYNTIRQTNDKNEWIFLLCDSFVEETENIKVITLPQIKNSKVKKLWFDKFSGKKLINKLNPDMVFSLQNIITSGVKAPQFVYIHQPLPFQTAKKYSFFKKKERGYAVYQYIIGHIIKKSAEKADKVFVQTKWMKDAVMKMCGVKGEKIVNVLPTVDDLSSYKNDGMFKNDYFFYPTGKALYKNNLLISRACEILKSKGIFDYSVELTTEGDDSENIKYLGRIDRESVLKKYNEGTLLFPSYIETFGYPMAEARQLGTVILASDCEFSREVLEGYENAYFFNPFDENELAELMERVIKKEIIPQKASSCDFDSENSWKIIISEILNA